MTPEGLYKALADMIHDVCGGHSPTRQEPISFDEWRELDARWLAIKQMNLRTLAMKSEGEAETLGDA